MNSLLTSLLRRMCVGGSISIIERRASTSSGSWSSSVIPRADENVRVSRRTSSMSRKRVTAQKPRFGGRSGCQWTGSCSRSVRNAQWGDLVHEEVVVREVDLVRSERHLLLLHRLLHRHQRRTAGSGQSGVIGVLTELPVGHPVREALQLIALEVEERLDERRAEDFGEVGVGFQGLQVAAEVAWQPRSPLRVMP
jgi:hypothetical protein